MLVIRAAAFTSIYMDSSTYPSAKTGLLDRFSSFVVKSILLLTAKLGLGKKPTLTGKL